MMGTKERAFGPLPPVTLEDLVPPDHFYRHLERVLDLGFVRDLVAMPTVFRRRGASGSPLLCSGRWRWWCIRPAGAC
jgi:hypothetical protein